MRVEKLIDSPKEKTTGNRGNTPIRVRFAPSPTGELHVGGARTALYNWLFVRHHGGKFILRIEDTDQTRSTEEAITVIIESLKWLGLSWDEGPGAGGKFGPYRQTERLEIYHLWSKRLLAEEKAYYCYCLPDELASRRERASKAGRPLKYDRRCRRLDQSARRLAELRNPKPALRFAAPLEGETVVVDLIREEIKFQNSDIEDFVILRSDWTPTYNFVVVIDDALMKITHVIRGDDHLSNTPKQLLLYKALDFLEPQFAHLPMILGSDKKPLSKRLGATSVNAFRESGYLPQALVNYLALLGWSYDEKTTFFTLDELIDKFSLDKVSRNPAVFDFSKLEWMNGHYLRGLSPTELAKQLIPYLGSAGLIGQEKELDLNWLEQVVSISQERIKTLSEFAMLTGFFFKEDIDYEPEATTKILSFDFSAEILARAKRNLSHLAVFKSSEIEQVLRQICLEMEISPSKGLQPVRFAITGKLVSPPLFETMELLGGDKCLSRLDKGRCLLNSAVS